jgi:hypothetical protein
MPKRLSTTTAWKWWGWEILKHVLKLFLASSILLASCAPLKVEMPSYEGKTFRQVLSGLQDVSEVRTRFSIAFLKDGREREGDAALDLAKDGDMSLRLYSLGFLAMKLSSKDGHVESSHPIDPGDYFILTEGLRDCFFWWDVRDYTLSEGDGYYILANRWRTVWVDRKTFLPVMQNIRLDNVRDIYIRYDRPRRDGDVWFQSQIKIEYREYTATLSVSRKSFQRSSPQHLHSQ